MVVSNTDSVVTTNKTNNTTLYVLDTTIHKTQTTTNTTNNTTLYVFDTTIHKTQTTTNKTNNTTLYFVVVMCLVYGCVQHI
jgi:hypothetical protein